MRIERANPASKKGWCFGPWNSDIPIPVGYANEGIDEPHLHKLITEIYLVASGSSAMLVELEQVTLHAGDVIVIEPGEAHTFLSSSPDYLHFVIHVPPFAAQEIHAEKQAVPRSRLGLGPKPV
jgi:mannose-6-phosphate isomerase-like protein (cupin superfamily)